jgi:hypothetical protein
VVCRIGWEIVGLPVVVEQYSKRKISNINRNLLLIFSYTKKGFG